MNNHSYVRPFICTLLILNTVIIHRYQLHYQNTVLPYYRITVLPYYRITVLCIMAITGITVLCVLWIMLRIDFVLFLCYTYR